MLTLSSDDLINNVTVAGYYPEKVKSIGYNNFSNATDVGVINFSQLTDVVHMHYQFGSSATSKHSNWQPINNFHKLKWVKVLFKNGSEIMSGNLHTNFPDLRYSEFQEWKPDILSSFGGAGFPNLYIFVVGLQTGSVTSTEIDLILNNISGGSTITNGYLGFAPLPVRTSASNTAYTNLIGRGWNLQITNP